MRKSYFLSTEYEIKKYQMNKEIEYSRTDKLLTDHNYASNLACYSTG